MNDARQPSQATPRAAMPPNDRRDNEGGRREDDALYTLLEHIREAQATGIAHLGTQIEGVQARIEVISTKNNDAAIANAIRSTQQDGRIEALEKAIAAQLVQIGELRAKLEPLQFAWAKVSALAVAVAGGATFIVQALDLFHRSR